LDAVGVLAVAALIVLATLPTGTGAATFPGLLVAASGLTVVAIATAARPGAWLGRALDVAPLRWIGERSFGLYLWHWPVVVLLTAAVTGASPDVAVPVPVGVATLVLSVAAAMLSYRFIEQPVRRRGLRGSVATLGRALRGRPVRRFAATLAVAAGAALVAGTTAAVAAAPAMASSESVVAQGQNALDAASADPRPTPTISGAALRPGVAPLPPQCATANLSDEVGVCVAPDGRPVMPKPADVPGSRISAVGDSVMLASAKGLLERMPGIDVDAKVSRSMTTGTRIVSRLSAKEKLRDYVVVALGTNGTIDAADLRRLREDIGPERTLVLVNAYAPRDWIPGVNRTIEEFARTTPGVVVADWSSAIAKKTDLLAGDKIHPGADGGRVFAAVVEKAVQDAANDRAELRYRIELAQWSVREVFGGDGSSAGEEDEAAASEADDRGASDDREAGRDRSAAARAVGD
ncbi:acyltransferase family protein, partial [Microbacterium sp.]|uniref:acyltransferase family protein n=1 Tax=Microbacterium sp. TaxID=51671 RepID=UPI0037370CBE